MKKIILLSLVFFTLFSCGDEVQFNTPAFQGDRENELWRAKSFFASIETNGFLTITGRNNNETVKLRIPSISENTYIVGSTNVNVAEYIDNFGVAYSTSNSPHESVSVYPELGEIVIEEIDVVNKTFTGTYRFLAFDAAGLNSVGFTNGIFYKVPLLHGQFPSNAIVCEDTEIASDVALVAYQATFSSDLLFINSTDYETACNTYLGALNNQISYCGDANGALQTIIDGLGSCQISCAQATANVVEAESQYVAATTSNFIAKCEQYTLYLQEQIEICGDTDGSIQAIIDTLVCE